MLKFKKVATLLRTRISRGDYALTGIPVEEHLATEAGVSRITVRKAVGVLVKEGLLRRQSNGRLVANANGRQKTHYVAFLAPAFESSSVTRYRVALEIAAADMDTVIRPVEFVHWTDPVISQTLERFDGVMLSPSAEAMPESLFERIHQADAPVVVLGIDCSQQGLPSVGFDTPAFIQHILVHLKDLGHRQIDFFNTQPEDSVIKERRNHWRAGLALHDLQGESHDSPVAPYQPALTEARRFMGQLLDTRRLSARAVLCGTEAAAIGVLRACYERGIRVGRDLSVASVCCEALAKDLCPSITSLDMVDPVPYFRLCLQWMLRDGQDWAGSLHLQPAEVPLFIGESTGPCPVHV